MVGMVSYIDYESETFSDDNVLNYVIHKRRSFEYEKEVRAMRWLLVPTEDASEEKRLVGTILL